MVKPREAEFAKLFNNAYRYIEFAIANQFYLIAKSAGLDYRRDRPRDEAQLSARARHSEPGASPPGRACSRTPCSFSLSRKTSSASAMRPCWSTKALCCTWSTISIAASTSRR